LGGVGGDVARGDPGAADRHDQVDPTDHGGVQRVADRDRIAGYEHHTVDHQPGFFQQFRDERTGRVLTLPMAHAVVHDNDESPADLGWRHLHG
jgi:hypothetical protein